MNAWARPVRCPTCGEVGLCTEAASYGKPPLYFDFECACGSRFRADFRGRVLREFNEDICGRLQPAQEVN